MITLEDVLIIEIDKYFNLYFDEHDVNDFIDRDTFVESTKVYIEELYGELEFDYFNIPSYAQVRVDNEFLI